MTENSWVLRGIDADARQKAEAEADRLGVSLAEYLTDIVLQGAVLGQLAQEAAPALEAADFDEPGADAPTSTAPAENFAVRHRLDAIERRLGLAVGGLDGAIHNIDSSLFGLASRLDEAETLGANTADALDAALADLAGNLTALRRRLGDAEDGVGALNEGLEAARTETGERCAGIDQRLNVVEDIARGADAAAGALACAHETLKYAVADDFSAFARESAARLEAGLQEVRAIADDAAAEADAASARMRDELQNVRAGLEERLADSAAETRARMQAAFSDAAERMASLAERLTENERFAARSAEQLRSQIADVEDSAQTALEETAETLRQAGAALATDLQRTAHDTRSALESIHADLSNEIAELRERQAGGLARLKLVDAAATNTIGEVVELREALQAGLQQAQADADARFDAFATRLAGAEADAAQVRELLAAEVERVEACTFAALEKLSGDMTAHADLARGEAAITREQLETQLADIRDQHVGAMARLKLLDKALGAHDLIAAAETGGPAHERLQRLEAEIGERALDREFSARLGRLELVAGRQDEALAGRVAELEAAADAAQTEQMLADLKVEIATLAEQLEAQRVDESIMQRIEEVRGRIAKYDAQAGEAADRIHGVSRMLGRLTAQNADAATQSEERLHKIELALADLRLDKIGGADEGEAVAVQAIEQRVAEMEQRQAEVFEALRADIAHFIGENDRRLAQLEETSLTASFETLIEAMDVRLAQLEQRDVAAEFEALRQRLDERILGVEQRSVRAMEQVAETVALLEQRLHGGDARSAQSA